MWFPGGKINLQKQQKRFFFSAHFYFSTLISLACTQYKFDPSKCSHLIFDECIKRQISSSVISTCTTTRLIITPNRQSKTSPKMEEEWKAKVSRLRKPPKKNIQQIKEPLWVFYVISTFNLPECRNLLCCFDVVQTLIELSRISVCDSTSFDELRKGAEVRNSQISKQEGKKILLM